MSQFPKDFIWGCATSAYQIEGGVNLDNKGDSVWDVFCRQSGRVYDGHTGEVACDHYHRYEEDFALMEKLGIKHYRFSFSWTRILPLGTGEVNLAGIAFYNRLIDSMLAHNITPYATLFHWDYPYELFCKGGWLNEESSDWFARYTEVIAKYFGDRIKVYFTLNEPQCFIGISYKEIVHAPGIKFSDKDLLTMAHNVLLAHGKAVRVLREKVDDVVVGYAPTGVYYHPASEDPADIEAAKKATFDCRLADWEFSVAYWSDPVVLGYYPQVAEENFGELMPKIKAGDMELISLPLDIYAQNIYHSRIVKAWETGYQVVPYPAGSPKTAFNWPITPECLYWPLKFLDERYSLPLMITENGLSSLDCLSLDGKVHDASRMDYLQKHLLMLRKVISEGVNVQAYFHWSFMDNFEWNSGYFERFGLVYVDFESLKRTAKDSADYYSKIIASNGSNLEEPWATS